jgi:hypothetical protein
MTFMEVDRQSFQSYLHYDNDSTHYIFEKSVHHTITMPVKG